VRARYRCSGRRRWSRALRHSDPGSPGTNVRGHKEENEGERELK